jgi:excisionase family DNA binding protein
MAAAEPEVTRPRIVSVPEAAKQLGVSRDYMYRLVRSGEIASIRMPSTTGGKRGTFGWGLRIEQAEIDAFIERARESAS